MKRFALLLALCWSASVGAACIPGVGTWSIGSTTATLSVCAADGNTTVELAGAAPSIPSGMIAAFNAACPAGWTELTAARGRVIVGVPAAGTLAGTVGTALTDLQDKSVAISVLNHTHAVNVTDPGHVHTQRYHSAATGGLSGPTTAPDTSSNTPTNYGITTASGTTGITATTDNPAGGVASQNITMSALIATIQLRYCSKD